MFEHRLEHLPQKRVFIHWFLLCFNAGCINAGGLLATGRYVSHVTGFATLAGVDISKGEYQAFLGILSVPLFFLLGSMIAGLLIDRQIYLGRKPHYDYVMLLGGICVLLTALNEKFHHWGHFGEVLHLRDVYFILILLCLASGLQNAAITSSSGSSVRTTHLTGIATDLGLGIARILTLKKGNPQLEKEKTANLLRIGSSLSFIMGSALSSWLFMKWRLLGFLPSAGIFLFSAIQGRKIKRAKSRF